MNISISCVVITLNEERNLARCLQSLYTVADELVVVDSFSTDKTEEIARSFGARFMTNKFVGHIEQKNFAKAQATNDYILSLDADEELSAELIKSILEVKANWKSDGYFMNRLSNYCGQWIRHSGWYPDTKMRLFDRRKGQWKGRNPHDQYNIDAGNSTSFLKGDILHYTYYTVEEHRRQAEKFANIAAQSHFDAGIRSSYFMLVVKTVSKFIRNYIIKAGFLDGRNGFIICRITAWETWMKYKKLILLTRNARRGH